MVLSSPVLKARLRTIAHGHRECLLLGVPAYTAVSQASAYILLARISTQVLILATWTESAHSWVSAQARSLITAMYGKCPSKICTPKSTLYLHQWTCSTERSYTILCSWLVSSCATGTVFLMFLLEDKSMLYCLLFLRGAVELISFCFFLQVLLNLKSFW